MAFNNIIEMVLQFINASKLHPMKETIINSFNADVPIWVIIIHTSRLACKFISQAY